VRDRWNGDGLEWEHKKGSWEREDGRGMGGKLEDRYDRGNAEGMEGQRKLEGRREGTERRWKGWGRTEGGWTNGGGGRVRGHNTGFLSLKGFSRYNNTFLRQINFVLL
jgi:hypothetical protein